MKLYRANLINPVSYIKTDFIKDAGLLIDKGKIIAKGKFHALKKKYPNAVVIDRRDDFIAPGFIDAHLHLPQINQRARFGESLLEWLNKYIIPAEENFRNLKIAEKEINFCYNELIKNGTTTSVIYSSHHKEATDMAFEIAAAKGIKVFLGKMMMDFDIHGHPKETTKKSLDDSFELCEKWHNYDNKRIRYIFSPRFAICCTETLMKEIADYAAKNKIFIQSHLSENLEEINQVLEIFFGYKNYTQVYYKNNLLSERTLMGHCIHLKDEEFEMLKETGTKIAHCPSSNFFLKSGKFDLRKAQSFGIEIGLGSDVGAGPNLSMFDVLKSMNYTQNYHILPQKCFYYATKGNAKILGIDNETGSLDAGKDADFIIINIKKYHPHFNYSNIEDLLAFLIYLGNHTFIENVYIRGKKMGTVPIS